MRVGHELAIIISYPNSTSGIIVLLKTPRKYREFFPTLFVQTTYFHLVFNFEQTRTVDIFGGHAGYNGQYTMMAKLMRALELHYPIIQFFIVYAMKLPQMDSLHLNSYVSFRNQVAWSHHKLLYHTVEQRIRSKAYWSVLYFQRCLMIKILFKKQ